MTTKPTKTTKHTWPQWALKPKTLSPRQGQSPLHIAAASGASNSAETKFAMSVFNAVSSLCVNSCCWLLAPPWARRVSTEAKVWRGGLRCLTRLTKESDVSPASQGLRLLVVEGADTAAKAGHRRLSRNDLKSGVLFANVCFAGCSWQNAGAAGCLVLQNPSF